MKPNIFYTPPRAEEILSARDNDLLFSVSTDAGEILLTKEEFRANLPTLKFEDQGFINGDGKLYYDIELDISNYRARLGMHILKESGFKNPFVLEELKAQVPQDLISYLLNDYRSLMLDNKDIPEIVFVAEDSFGNPDGWYLRARPSGVKLAFATWNDIAGIRSLIEQAKDGEMFSLRLALTNPSEAATWVQYKKDIDVLSSYQVDQPELTSLMEDIAEHRDYETGVKVAVKEIRFRSLYSGKPILLGYQVLTYFIMPMPGISPLYLPNGNNSIVTQNQETAKREQEILAAVRKLGYIYLEQNSYGPHPYDTSQGQMHGWSIIAKDPKIYAKYETLFDTLVCEDGQYYPSIEATLFYLSVPTIF